MAEGGATKKEIGGYSIHQTDSNVLGRGSFGVVYKCQEDEDGKQYAAKLINLHQLPQDDKEKLIMSEIMPSNLTHRNIVEILHIQMAHPEMWIIMELCSMDLAKYLQATPPDIDTCKLILLQCADGLEYLHANKVTHRDIKPNNILLKEASTFPIVKFTDFSFARGTEGCVDSYLMTVARGNVRWIAPELLNDVGELNPSAHFTKAIDLFSIGLVFIFICVTERGHQQFRTCRLGFEVKKNADILAMFADCWRHPALMPSLCSVIQELLCVNHRQRLTAHSLACRLHAEFMSSAARLDAFFSYNKIADERMSHPSALAEVSFSPVSSAKYLQQDTTETDPRTSHTEMSKIDLIRKLGLQSYYPGKIKRLDVMCIRNLETPHSLAWADLPWVILEKIIMLDHRARDEIISKCESGSESTALKKDFEKMALDFLGDEDKDNVPHPLDVFLVTYQCCDPFLQQSLAKKMSMCRLAIPFLIPDEKMNVLCSLWALETIVIEWCRGQEDMTTSYKPVPQEASLIKHPMKIISFMRVGRPSYSKSKLLNEVLAAKGHNIFCNFDCPNGGEDRYISNGLVELSSYLPSGKESDVFKEESIFLNLRGCCSDFPNQTFALNYMSTATVIIIDILELPKIKHKVQQFLGDNAILLLTSAAVPSKKAFADALHIYKELKTAKPSLNVSLTFTQNGLKSSTKITEELQHGLISAITKINVCKSLADYSDFLEKRGITITEKQCIDYMTGHAKAKDIVIRLTEPLDECKKNTLILQGELWNKWAHLQKALYRAKESSDDKSIHEIKEDIKKEMDTLRHKQQQQCSSLPKLIRGLLKYMNDVLARKQKPSTLEHVYLMQCIKMEMDAISRNVLPGLQKEYSDAWEICNIPSTQKMGGTTTNLEVKKKLSLLERKIAHSSFGFEHLVREIGQVYEASGFHRQKWKYIPNIAAMLLLQGYPLEIMDGDAACIPLKWVTAVFRKVSEQIGKKKVYVLSAIGIQSSGKSTLLNAMFGLEFAVSAGRCTRGVYAQLIPVHRHESFDYLLILDSEGLRAPELASEKYCHDNELATLVIGLADLTLINLKGENTSEMKDVLQIVVHAFLRMKLADEHKRQKCIFVHQNVSALNAHDKMVHGLKQLQQSLDEMTEEASQTENVSFNSLSFSEIIEFRGKKDVWYVSDLWNGDPPMAPVNPGYSGKIKDLKSSIIQRMEVGNVHKLTIDAFIERINNLWQAILADDFVFSFRNTRAIRAHLSLERNFSTLKHVLEQNILEGLRAEIGLIQKCQTAEDLAKRTEYAMGHLDRLKTETVEQVLKKLDVYFDETEYQDILNHSRRLKCDLLKLCADKATCQMKQQLQSFHDQQYLTAFKHLKEKEIHKAKVMKEAITQAIALKDNVPSKIELDEIFETMWPKVVAQQQHEISLPVIRAEMETKLLKSVCFDQSGITVDKVVTFMNVRRSEGLLCGSDIGEEDFNAFYMPPLNKLLSYKKEAKREIVDNINNTLWMHLPGRIIDLLSKDSMHCFSKSESFILDVLDSLKSFADVPLKHFEFSLTNCGRAKFTAYAISEVLHMYMKTFGTKVTTDIGSSEAQDIKKSLESSLGIEAGKIGRHNLVSQLLLEKANAAFPLYASLAGINGAWRSTQYLPKTKEWQHVPSVLKSFLEELDVTILSICNDDSRFLDAHVTTLVQKLTSAFHNMHKLSLCPENIADLAIITIHHAAPKFALMNQRFDARHTNRNHLQQYKEEVKVHFTNCIHACGPAISAANVFCSIIKREVLEYVRVGMSMNVVRAIMDEIGHTKTELIVAVLADLLGKSEFSKFIAYIKQSLSYTQTWLQAYLDQFCFGKNMYMAIAKREVESIIHCCKDSVNKATMYGSKGQWVSNFCEGVNHTIPLHENDFRDVNIHAVASLEEVEVAILEIISELQNDIATRIGTTDSANVQWGPTDPCSCIMKTLWGCKEQCPFCNEPCMKTEHDSTEEHMCLQHRPIGLNNWFELESEKLVVNTCSVYVAGSTEFRCRIETCVCRTGHIVHEPNEKGWILHNYKEYKKYRPCWDIAPDIVDQGSPYWKWVFCTYEKELVKSYERNKPDIPESWRKVTKNMARESLNVYGTK